MFALNKTALYMFLISFGKEVNGQWTEERLCEQDKHVSLKMLWSTYWYEWVTADAFGVKYRVGASLFFSTTTKKHRDWWHNSEGNLCLHRTYHCEKRIFS